LITSPTLIAAMSTPLTVLVLLGAAVGLVIFGLAWRRFIVLAVLAGVMTAAFALSDILYFGFGINLIGYCGEPQCDPGPIPAIILTPALIFPLFFVAIGIRIRHDWLQPNTTR
jgi:hypothetical protein